ncbi:neurofibromin [Caerostris extrusa]|uniref:Neurofibromin n=1 Tax=Caerostris extrusa TaxID=172846 RepID=A0AAV4Y3Y7_CAEEX|nr:neurofibromin [Caerostris extrusa]
MADTAVALASANVQLVALKVISRLCRVIEKTCASPTPTLEQHLMWDDIAILARYLLMLSFNNSLDVASHLPYLFHIVTLLVHTGPVSLRASIHGLVINLIHSLCTCTKPSFGETQRILRLSLDEFSLPKFYLLFGISKVKSAAVTAFRSNCRHVDRTFGNLTADNEPMPLASF